MKDSILPWLAAGLISIVLLTSCGGAKESTPTSTLPGEGAAQMAEGGTPMNGTAWGSGAFRDNGERIYFTATSERGTDITYRGGPDVGMMMMGGQLSCASCHGPDARGGQHVMHMQLMDAPNIRWAALAEHGHEEGEGDANDHAAGEEHEAGEGGYTLEMFRKAVIEGQHPDGEPLDEEMPRWQMSDQDLRDLAAYLQSFPAE